MRVTNLLGVAVVIHAVGCMDLASLPEGLECSPAGDCPAGQTCFDGVCLAEPPKGDPADTNPPTIVSMTPGDGVGEVLANEPVVITFSEPMDPYATQAALSIEPQVLVLEQEWNDDYTELRVVFDLAYAEAFYPDEASAREYRVTLSSVAMDVSGNPLPTAGVTHFATKTRTLHLFDVVPILSGNTSNPYGGNWSFIGGGDISGTRYHAFVSFDISAFPDEEVANIESAVIDTSIAAIDGDPCGLYGDWTLEHSNYATEQDADDAPALRQLGTFVPATPAPAVGDVVLKDVTEAFRADIDFRDARANLSQYLIRFPDAPATATAGRDFLRVHSNSAAGFEAKDRTILVVRTLSGR